mgnify:CR=1 FL=1
MRQRAVLAACFGVALAVATGVIAAGANPQAYVWTLVGVAGVLVLPLGVLGWFLAGALAPTPPGEASGAGPAAHARADGQRGTRQRGGARGGGGHEGGGQRRGQEAAVAAQRELNDRASSAAWRDTVMITGAVLVVVAFVGVQWPTSYVLLGVIVVALVTQAVRQILVSRERT